jgi:hypothetical protein
MAGEERITDYDALGPFYLSEHSTPRTRAMHYFGTLAALFGIVVGSVLGKP